jgi:long-chain acyl-CoA synthetase
MLTLANVEFAIKVLCDEGAFTSPPPGPDDLLLSYLPLSHVAERIFTTWFNAAAATQVCFAESIDTVPQDLREVQPTILFGVPRIWEKLLAGVETRLTGATLLKRLTTRFWLKRATAISEVLAANGGHHTRTTRALYAVGWFFCYRSLTERLGMRRIRHATSGAAPIAPEVLKFFMGIGVPMHEAYGMTENTAVATSAKAGRIRLGTVGEAHPGVEVRIDEVTGEILTRHPAVFAGYWGDPAATAEVLEPDGWLHTGDVGEWVDGTYLTITDRMKDIIITAGGKNVSPSQIENELKASPYVKEALVVGDGRKYLTALVGIDLDTVGEWAQRQRLGYSTLRDLTEKPEVVALLKKVVDDVNGRFASVEQVKAFRLLPKELDHEDGELTATQKLKRAAVVAAFADLVESMYDGRPTTAADPSGEQK